jgi:lysine 2,3-aminomutase
MEERWNDWKWQFRHRITTTEQLKSILPLSAKDELRSTLALARFAWRLHRITRL